MTLNRRELCVAGAWSLAAAVSPVLAAGSTAAAATPKPGAQPAKPSAGLYDAIVLGAGVAGLNSAWLLEQQGLKVLVLEGRMRVGGRILTLFDQPGHPEMGFASMGPAYGRGIDAAKRAGLELVDVAPRFVKGFKQELVLGREFVSRDAWATSPANPFPSGSKQLMPWELSGKLVSDGNPLKDPSEWLEAKSAPFDVSMHEFLKSKGLSDAAIGLAFDTQPYFGSSSYDVSALMLEFSDAWVKSQRAFGPQAYMIKGGNLQLPMAMAKMLKGDLLFGKEVVGIASESDAATVTCADGSVYRGKRVVSSLPFATLRHVRITPDLQGGQRQAVSTLAYQPISIAYLTVKSRFWETDGHSPSMWTDGPLGTVMAQQLGPKEDEVTGLLVMARSELARYWDGLGKAATSRMILDELAAIRPASKGQVTVAALHSWAMERFNAGDWAYYGPGQVSGFVKDMAAPSDRLHFCGEHTAVSNRGLEGAFESSERVAIEVLTA